MRIGKAGYIEVPSMKSELTKGIMDKKYAGYYHHRWLIEVVDNKIIFRFKPHFIHNDKRFHFPRRFLKRLSKRDKVNFLFWDKKFEFEERIQISIDKIQEFLFNYIKENFENGFLYSFLSIKTRINDFLVSLRKKIFPHKYYHKYMEVKEFVSQ